MRHATNPFHYGTPAEGEYFTGREQELSALLSRMRNGINVVLISPRRYGKTSLHRAARSRLERQSPKPAYVEVNVLRAGNGGRLAGLLTAGAFHMSGSHWGRARQAVPEFARRLRVSPAVTFDPGGNPRFGFEAGLGGADVEAVLADVYGLLDEAAQKRPAVLVLDEFQAVTRIDPALPDVLKALADDHPGVALVLAGSRRHMMEELVIERHAPLYGMAERIALGPLPPDEMAAFVTARTEAGGKGVTPAGAAAVVALAGPVPNDIQRLAYEAFDVAGPTLDEAAVETGMARAVGHDAASYAEAVSRLSPGQARVLVALAAAAAGADQPFSAAFARSVGLAGGASVRKALQPLLGAEDVVVRDGRHVVADPFFAEWLRAG